MSGARQVRLRALAKVNLDLRVLGRRPDGYHELRTIFQTISLGDALELAFTPGRTTKIELEEDTIPDNLVLRAAQAAMDAMRATGRVRMRLTKRVPMGAGLGGGSSDAAAVLLALPVLAGREVALPDLCRLGQQLGSDVPFFLMGGRAVGIGRGTELFPLVDGGARQGVLVAPGIHVSTAEAYRLLDANLTTELQENKIFSFQSKVWGRGDGRPAGNRPPVSGRGDGKAAANRPPVSERGSGKPAKGRSTAMPREKRMAAANDFEAVVFEQHEGLRDLKKRLQQAGAEQAMMTGSGSAVFGLFGTAKEASLAAGSLAKKELVGKVLRFSLVSRARYRSMWWRALEEHSGANLWPPRSRYLR